MRDELEVGPAFPTSTEKEHHTGLLNRSAHVSLGRHEKMQLELPLGRLFENKVLRDDRSIGEMDKLFLLPRFLCLER